MIAPLILLVGGVVVGGYIYHDERAQAEIAAAARATRRKLGELRLPMPDFAVVLPQDESDYETLDVVVSDCISSINFVSTPSVETQVEAASLCTAHELYPDFPWPPMVGDHPSTSELWSIIKAHVRRTLTFAA